MSAAASHLLVSLRRACAAGVSMLNPALESLCSLASAIILRWMFSRNIHSSGSLINYLYTSKHHAHRDLLVQIDHRFVLQVVKLLQAQAAERAYKRVQRAAAPCCVINICK